MKSVRIHQGYLYHQRSCCSLSSMAMDLRSTPRHRKTKASSSTLDRSTAGVDMDGWGCVSLGFVVVRIDELSCESVELHSRRVISCLYHVLFQSCLGDFRGFSASMLHLWRLPETLSKAWTKRHEEPLEGTLYSNETRFWAGIYSIYTIYPQGLQFHAPKRMKSRCLTIDEFLWGIWPGSFVASFKSFLWPDPRITDVFLGLLLMLLLLSTSLRINFHVE